MIHAFDDFELDDENFTLTRSGVRVAVQPRPFQLLLHLVRQRQRLVPRREVMETLWPGRSPSEASLDRAVRTARRALGDDGHSPRFIATVRCVGFRFLPRVDRRAPGDDGPRIEREHLALLLEAAEMASELARRDLARRHSLEGARLARALGDDEGLVRAAVVAARSTGADADDRVRGVVRDALGRLEDAEDERRELLWRFLSDDGGPAAAAATARPLASGV